MKSIKSFCLTSIFIISSCSLVTDEYQTNQKKVLNYLLNDFPIPKNSHVKKEPTVLMESGGAVSGRITPMSSDSPGENLIFYGAEAPQMGWELLSTKAGEEVTLVFSKNGRMATIYITPRKTFAGFIQGDIGSDIDITLMHPDIEINNQFGRIILPDD